MSANADEITATNITFTASVGDAEMQELLRLRADEMNKQIAIGEIPDMNLAFDTTNFRWINEDNPWQQKYPSSNRPPWSLNVGNMRPVRKSELCGHMILQRCPTCRSHEQTRSLGIKAEEIDWRIDTSPAPRWLERCYEEFQCIQGHTFRSYGESPAPRPPAPGR